MKKALFKSVPIRVLAARFSLSGIGAGLGLLMSPMASAQTEPAKEEKPPHIVEKPEMKGRMESPWLPHKIHDGKVTEEDLLIASKTFLAKMHTYPDIRFREFFDPRYLKKHGLTEREIAFEVVEKWPAYQGIHNITVADDNQTVLCLLDFGGGAREALILRWVAHEGHLYISPEKAPDPKTGIFTPWILRKKVK